MPRSTSVEKKNFPSAGTIMICNLSERRSATILLIKERVLLQDGGLAGHTFGPRGRR